MAPSLMQNVFSHNPIKPLQPSVAKKRWAYTASLQRLWLDSLTDWALLRPIQRLGQDLYFFDDQIVDRFMGAPGPAIRAMSSLAQQEEKKLGARLDDESLEFAKGTGLAGKLTAWSALMVNWFEKRWILQETSKPKQSYGRQLSMMANRFENLVLRPRYLVLFVIITLMVAF
jgi:hypothetical protein